MLFHPSYPFKYPTKYRASFEFRDFPVIWGYHRWVWVTTTQLLPSLLLRLGNLGCQVVPGRSGDLSGRRQPHRVDHGDRMMKPTASPTNLPIFLVFFFWRTCKEFHGFLWGGVFRDVLSSLTLAHFCMKIWWASFIRQWYVASGFQKRLWNDATVDRRNPAPPGMYKTL